MQRSGTGDHAARSFRMHQAPEPNLPADFEADSGEAYEDDVNEMVRRLAASVDSAVRHGQDSRVLVAEALLRLALGVHLFATGAETTRARLLTMALRTGAGGERVH